jgi:uncharacterized protein YutE (UPF0331/DUF86 family)
VVDRDLLLRKLAMLWEYLAQLGEYRSTSAEAYKADWRAQRVVERTLHLAIEVCTDVMHHAIADRRLRVPSTYAETFEIGAEAGLIPERLREPLVKMARFRNLLVHDYARIDPEIVLEILRSRLDDLASFAGIASEWPKPAPPEVPSPGTAEEQ